MVREIKSTNTMKLDSKKRRRNITYGQRKKVFLLLASLFHRLRRDVNPELQRVEGRVRAEDVLERVHHAALRGRRREAATRRVELNSLAPNHRLGLPLSRVPARCARNPASDGGKRGERCGVGLWYDGQKHSE